MVAAVVARWPEGWPRRRARRSSRSHARTRATWWVSTWATSWSRAKTVAIDDDVLLANLNDLAFEIEDFNNWTFGGEWLFGVSNYLETGVGVGYYQRTVTIGLPRLRERQRQRDRAGPQAQDRADHRRPFASCRSAAARRSSPTLAAASASSTGATPSRVSSSISRTTRFSASSTRRMARPSGPVIVAGLRIPGGRRVHRRLRVQVAEGRGRHQSGRERAPRQTRSISAATPSASRCTSASEASRRSPVEGYAAAFGHALEPLQEIAPTSARADRRRRRLRRAPRWPPTSRTRAVRTASPPSTLRRCPSCRKSCTAKPSRDRSCM